MKKHKYIFPAFSFYDRTGIQQYLEKKAQQGWMLEKVGGYSWKFRAIEPKKLHFAVTYFPKASAFDPSPSEEQQMLQEFCAHSGWNLVAASAQMQIFYNESEDPVPIETDPAIELENIHKTARKTYLPTWFMLIPVGIMPWLTLCMSWQNDPVAFLSTNIYFFNMLTSLATLFLGGTEMIGYFRWRSKAKKAAEDGEFVATKGSRNLQLVLVGLILIGLVLFLAASADLLMRAMMVSMLVLIAVAVAISVGAMKLMKRMNFPARKNQVITFVIIIVTTLVACGLGTFGVLAAMDEVSPEEENPPTYEYHGETWTLYRDEIPLTIQDMMEVDPEIYSYRMGRSSESLLVKIEEAYQRPRYDMLDRPDIQYTIVEVKAGFLYDFCLTAMLEGEKDAWSEDIYGNITYAEYRQVDAIPWGADWAYEEYIGENAMGSYLLCYGNLIIELKPDWEMTRKQMAVVGSIFG